MIAGGSKCAMADKDCRPPLEWHHAVRQQRLKREFPFGARRDPAWSTSPWFAATRPDAVVLGSEHAKTLGDILGDTRNRIFLCSHHHELVTNGRLKVALPESVWEFARDFNLVGMLENDLRRAA